MRTWNCRFLIGITTLLIANACLAEPHPQDEKATQYISTARRQFESEKRAALIPVLEKHLARLNASRDQFISKKDLTNANRIQEEIDAVTADLASARQPVPANRNIAKGKPTRCSRGIGDRAVDGNPELGWNSGAHAEQWIEIDLRQVSTVRKVRLRVSQSPAGDTVHQIFGSRSAMKKDPYKLLQTFKGRTEDGQWLEFAPQDPWTGIRFFKVVTVSSPSWVTWSEIEVCE